MNSAPAASLGFVERAAVENRIPETDEDGNTVYPEARGEIENGVHQLETLLESTVDKNFDKLEIYALRNILTVPEDLAPWMRLSHYRGLNFSMTDDGPSVESLQLLRRKVKETQKLNKELQIQSRRNAAIIEQLHGLLQLPYPTASGQEVSPTSLSFLTSDLAAQRLKISFSTEASSEQPLLSSTTHAISRLAELSKLHGTLSTRVGQLEAGRQGGDSKDRRNYIESQTRRRLEQDGIDVDSGEGLSRGGYAIGVLGRSVGVEEVRAIEQVVELIGAQPGVPTKDDDDDIMME